LLKYCIIITIADIPLDNIIPRIRTVIISFTLEDITIIRNITAPAPAQAAATRIQLPRPARLSGVIIDEKPRITKATPRLAPELIPSISGPAIGFLKTVCICKPLNDNAMPTVNAVIAFGNLNFRIIVSKSPCEFRNKAFKTSEGFIFTDPRNISSISNAKSKRTRPEKMSLVLLPE
jgi:hypothetical protein